MIAALVSGSVVILFVLLRRFAPPLGPLSSPVVLAALVVGMALAVTGTPVTRFETLAAPLHWALGPALVALGALVYGDRAVLRAQGLALVAAVVGGAAVGVASAALLARALGLSEMVTAATLTRTISTPFAILVQARVGGPVPLAAAFAVLAGVIGAVGLPPLFRALRLHGAATTGVATGVAAHIVGTDAIGRRDGAAGAFAGTAMVLAGAVVAVVLPPLWRWLAG